MKKKGILLFLFLLLMIPSVVFAEKPTTVFEGVVTAKPGDTVAYDVKVTTDTLKPSKYHRPHNKTSTILQNNTAAIRKTIATHIK